MKIYSYFLLILMVFIVLTFGACVPADRPEDIPTPQEDKPSDPVSGDIMENGHPSGWNEETHGKDASPNYELLFDHNGVLRLDFTIAPDDWKTMLDDMTDKFGPFGTYRGNGSLPSFDSMEFWNWGGDENPVYVPCNMVFEGKTWYHVGIRFKGNSSLKTTWQKGSYKLPLRLTFDKFEDDYPEIKNQRFYGFKKLGLSSGEFDNSLAREKITNEIFQTAGIPVGRDVFCQVYVNFGEGKKYFGLYTLQEIPAKPMLMSNFIEDDGNLYKPDGNSASFNKWNPEDFDKETNEEKADFSDVQKLYNVLHSDRKDEAAFMDRLEKVFDVDTFLHYLAINQVICNWDTYGNIPHNYYLYHDPGDDLLHWIPFDFNFSLETIGLMPSLSLELGPNEVSRKWPLIRFILDIHDYHARYVYYVKKTIDDLFNPERMQSILFDTQERISPYVQAEEFPYSNLSNISTFDRAFKMLERHVTNRYQKAQQFVAKYQDELTPSGR